MIIVNSSTGLDVKIRYPPWVSDDEAATLHQFKDEIIKLARASYVSRYKG